MRETTASVKKFCTVKPEMISEYFCFTEADIQKLYAFMILNIN